MNKVVVDNFFKKTYYFSFEKVIIKLDMVVPCSCKIHYLPQVSCVFFFSDLPLVYGLTKEE